MTTRRSVFGFTLVELLIVLSVLGLLVTLAIPSYLRSVELARRAVCQGNLRGLGSGYQACSIEESGWKGSFDPFSARIYGTEMGGKAVKASGLLGTENWASILTSRLGIGPNLFDCPSADAGDTFGAMPDIRLRIWGESWQDSHAEFEIYVTSTFPHWDYGPASRLAKQPGIWKFGELPEGGLPEYGDNVDLLPEYTPGPNPDVYYYVLDTGRWGDEYYAKGEADLDYNDIVLKVTETGSQVIVEAYQLDSWAGYNYNLVCSDTGEVYGDRDTTIARDGNNGPFVFSYVPVSYGINSQANSLPGGVDKVLILDYRSAVCNVGEQAGLDEGWNTLKAPRHFGKCNAVLANGSVRSVAPEEIDPEASETNYATYWAPGR
ncbi:MAG: prepilin-type N-terminal cleavage/methylation domain-containing protein [Planctomycetota bacterium]|jgi:general secretion pathway protein G